jgi:DNA-binding CsgD family transcriptional regulator
MPVSAASLQIFDGAIAALILTDMTRPTFTDVALLGRLFGLTGAEARLAALLGNGHDLASIAITLGVTRETLRSQLKAVFAKTGMRRQAELVALSARIRTPLH